MIAKVAQAGLWVAGWMVAGWLSARVDPGRYEGGRARDEQERARRNHSALAVMLGEFRTSVSDILFIKTERYMHGGVAYRHGPSKLAQGAQDLFAVAQEDPDAHGGDDSVHGHGHEEHDYLCESQGMETAIPRAENDFRGWIGDLYREVKPWRDPSQAHVHTDGRELLPWFRLMTLSDPHYVPGYLAGGFWLQKQGDDLALAFIEEGMRNNPDAFQLYLSRGLLNMRKARVSGRDPLAEADRHLLAAARDDCLRAAELGLARRPAVVDVEGTRDWANYQENDLLAACRLAILLSERLGDAPSAERFRERFAVLGPLFPPGPAEGVATP